MFYVPDSITPVKYLRVNVHIMDDSTGTENLSLEEARSFMKAMINNANHRLMENHKMNLPEGNTTPALNPKYQYVIMGQENDASDDGFYKHLDNDLYYFVNKGKNKNNYSTRVIDKYAINRDSFINIFLLPHHPDSVRSETYRPSRAGIALGTSLKMAGYLKERNAPWKSATLLNHEVGHILGLSHSWLRYDRCEDTPEHPNCWTTSEEPPCEGPASNNMMDYNASQMAITPCQLAIVHKGLSKDGHRNRKLCLNNWCMLDDSRTIMINDTVHWRGARDIVNNIIIQAEAELHIYCRVSMPAKSRITVRPGGKLILHDAVLENDCELPWSGVELQNKSDLKSELILYGESKIQHATSEKNEKTS